MNEQKLEKQRQNLVERGVLSPDENYMAAARSIIRRSWSEESRHGIRAAWQSLHRQVILTKDFHANTSIFLTAVLRNWENAIRDFFR